MQKILFVCHGNICRSVMAEYVMKDMINKRGLDRAFEVGLFWGGIRGPHVLDSETTLFKVRDNRFLQSDGKRICRHQYRFLHLAFSFRA